VGYKKGCSQGTVMTVVLLKNASTPSVIARRAATKQSNPDMLGVLKVKDL